MTPTTTHAIPYDLFVAASRHVHDGNHDDAREVASVLDDYANGLMRDTANERYQRGAARAYATAIRHLVALDKTRASEHRQASIKARTASFMEGYTKSHEFMTRLMGGGAA